MQDSLLFECIQFVTDLVCVLGRHLTFISINVLHTGGRRHKRREVFRVSVRAVQHVSKGAQQDGRGGWVCLLMGVVRRH